MQIKRERITHESFNHEQFEEFVSGALNFNTLAIYSRPPAVKEERGKVHDSLRA